MKLGVRWDEPTQDARIAQAYRNGLLDYAEANYPVVPGGEPALPEGLDIYVHCPVNPLASAFGPNWRLASSVRDAADEYQSPWIGEHLCWASEEEEGRLGYIVTPMASEEFVEIAVQNVRDLQSYYGRPVALELAPVYQSAGQLASEMHFLSAVAKGADARIILDVAHWSASNRNLGRSEDYGLSELELERIVELHVAGLRPNSTRTYWHDSHDRLPDDGVMTLAATLARELPSLQAITFEHAAGAAEEDFFAGLRQLNEQVRRD